ncbi:hypothetical protein E4U43_002635 [Claviceps pusilla]|uniref:Phytanoyl-CoA dioxygenase n=1 Tax=Claviceps pusilla TaxID=123648 RepID=A0A9P7NFV1_9HYPO|nr:hypothetical protein E4U43_002635 [Claviceps pusilla]
MPAQTDPASLVADLERDGFVIVRGILSGQKLADLRRASLEVEKLGRSGQWPHVRTVGKQFPPWEFCPEHGIWGIQHLMNPALPGHDFFTQQYFSEEVLRIVEVLLQCDDDDGDDDDDEGELVMELFNMLIRPDRDFELSWHRDDIPALTTPQEEMERLARPGFHAQYNLALWEDASLVVVPASHRRARSDVERRADPFEKALPGQLTVELDAGDIVFYNNNILHRGVYDATKNRVTLHGSVGHVAGGRFRARNVLQHGVGDYVDRVDLSRLGDHERRRAEGMRARLVKLGRESGEVGFSLEG